MSQNNREISSHFKGANVTREQMIRELIYHDIYDDRDEFLKEVLRHGWVGYERWEDTALVHACRIHGLLQTETVTE